MIALSALDRHDAGTLAGDTVVVTVMSNLGFHRAMAGAGISVVTTGVRRSVGARCDGSRRFRARG